MPIPVVPARPHASTHNSFDILTERNDEHPKCECSCVAWLDDQDLPDSSRVAIMVKRVAQEKGNTRSLSRELQSHGQRSQELELLGFS